MGPRSVAIVGGGVAGVSAARELRAQGFSGSLTIINRDGMPYDRPPLSKEFLLGASGPDDILLARPEWYESANVRLLTGSSVMRFSHGTVELADGRMIDADVSVIATGSTPRKLPVNSSGARNVHVLRTIADATELRNRIGPGSQLTIIGAGLIGAEVASSARALGTEVTLIDPAAPPLAGVLGTELAAFLHEHHATYGITTIQGTVDRFVLDNLGSCREVVLTSGQQVPVGELLIGIGALPALEVQLGSRVEIDGGILVDADGRTNDPSIFAAGDVARIRYRDGRLGRRTEHWEAARVDGISVANAILGSAFRRPLSDWVWSDRSSLHLEVAGSIVGDGSIVHRGAIGDSSFALFRLQNGRLAGAASVNDSVAVRAAQRLIELDVAVDPDQLADPGVSLRKLVRA